MNRRSIVKLAASIVCTRVFGVGMFRTAHARTATGAVSKYRLDIQSVGNQAAYNGVSPGLTIRSKAGDVIDVELINSLPALHDDCTDTPNQFHGLNTSNLHTHGLHVSPTTDSTGQYDADNVFISVVPLGQFISCDSVCGSEVKTSFRAHKAQYRFELGDDHPSGTNWYHAHKHGSTASQVGGGLSGPLIVDDMPNHMPTYIEQAKEKIFMLLNRGLVLVNPLGGGEVDPTITMRPGEVQRWRIINALGNSTFYSYLRTSLPELEMYLIAYDGLTLDERVPFDLSNLDEPWLNPATLASGNRVDLIVRAPMDGKGRSSSKPLISGVIDLINSFNIAQPFDLDIKISGDPIRSAWSDDIKLPGSGQRDFDDSPLGKRDVTFTQRVGIDEELFDGFVKQTMKKGSAEEWTVRNQTGAVHVFHIHVNPFYITHINGKELSPGDPLRRWQDTIGIPTGSRDEPGTVTYKTRFGKYTGQFVIHCHVLRHEDQGMMQIVEVVD